VADAVPARKALSSFLRAASLHQGDKVDDLTTLLPGVVCIAGSREAAPIIPFDIDREEPRPVALLVRPQRASKWGKSWIVVTEVAQLGTPGVLKRKRKRMLKGWRAEANKSIFVRNVKAKRYFRLR
jgi:hypothetical protein